MDRSKADRIREMLGAQNQAGRSGSARGDAGKKDGGRYRHRRTEVDGMKFDSMHEARVYQSLRARKEKGELKMILRQVPFDLPGGIVYKADFITFTEENGRLTVEQVIDAKSRATAKDRVYINKKKQLKAIYGIDITEVIE